MNPVDSFFNKLEEPNKSTFEALRSIIKNLESNISEKLSYGMPTFYYNNKRFCYLWKEKGTETPYIGFIDGYQIEHPLLIQQKRVRMKILYIDSQKDIAMNELKTVLNLALDLYKGQK